MVWATSPRFGSGSGSKRDDQRAGQSQAINVQASARFSSYGMSPFSSNASGDRQRSLDMDPEAVSHVSILAPDVEHCCVCNLVFLFDSLTSCGCNRALFMSLESTLSRLLLEYFYRIQTLLRYISHSFPSCYLLRMRC